MTDSLRFDIYKQQIFIKNKSLSLTYGETASIVARWAEYFKKYAPDNTIALAMPNCVESHLLLFAAMQNHNVILINPILLKLSPNLISRLGVVNLVSFDKITDANINEIIINRQDITQTTITTSSDPITIKNHLTLLSSGTTGEVKTVTLQPSEIKNYGSRLSNYFTFDKTDCLYNVLPYYHGFGLTRIFTVINSGSSYYIPEEPDYRNIVDDINQQKCTWISLVPNMAKVMTKNTGNLPVNFKIATVSADICDVTLIKIFRKRFRLDLLSEYGCTETSIISSNSFGHMRDGRVGKVTSDSEKIINGEIHAVAKWKNIPDWVNTGDIGKIDHDGYLYIKGRTKEIIKRQGKTIFPKELEIHLENVAGISEAVVYRDGTDNKGDRIGVAYVGTINESELKFYCVNNLPAEYRPYKVTKIDQIPRVGPKVRRTEVRQYVNEIQ